MALRTAPGATVTPGIDFEEARTQLDSGRVFGAMKNTPYYHDAVYPKFTPGEYRRRFRVTREKMAEMGLDCLIVCGGPSHWGYGAGVRWLTGHREWHNIAVYLVVPLEGEPTFVYSMGGTHAEATRRAVAPQVRDVRSSRFGRFGEVIVECIGELGLQGARIGITAVDPRYLDTMTINHYRTLREGLPAATFEFVGNFFHEFLLRKSPEEMAYVIRAGELVAAALKAIVETARPGVTEYELKAAAAYAILEGGGELDFLIIGSSPMAGPAIIFGNPRPSRRKLQAGDIILNELAAGFEGYTAQVGTPICVGEPTRQVREMWDEVVTPVFWAMAGQLKPGRTLREVWEASRMIRAKGYQSRPGHLHAIDLVSHPPGIGADGPHGEEMEWLLRSGMTLMLEPNPITLDGRLGLFLGHTYLITDDGHRRVTERVPVELLVAGG